MERAAFVLLKTLERSWWYRGRALVVQQALKRVGGGKRILDYGAGFGGMQATLARYGNVSAYEPDDEARSGLSARGYVKTYTDEPEALSEPYDLIGLFDVLEHIEDDGGFLRRAHDSLSVGGRLAITVPAMPFLWSTHDVTHKHFRRYTWGTLRRILTENGFEIEYLSYWNMFLLPPAALVRFLGRSGETSFHVPAIVNALLYGIIRLEVLLMHLVPLPFGISLIAVVHRKETT